MYVFYLFNPPGNHIPRVAVMCSSVFLLNQEKTMTPLNLAIGSPMHPHFHPLTPPLDASPFFSFKDFIYRKEAIAEGYLVDLSALSSTFKASVCMTREVWELYVVVNDVDLFRHRFRAVSLLSQARIAIKQASAHSTEAFFEVKRYPRRSQSFLNKIRLWIVVSSGDSDEPVLTIMLDTQHGKAL